MSYKFSILLSKKEKKNIHSIKSVNFYIRKFCKTEHFDDLKFFIELKFNFNNFLVYMISCVNRM